ncbi:MAG: hypothetical protein ACE5HD_00995 [Acidobacteriota bacterium]
MRRRVFLILALGLLALPVRTDAFRGAAAEQKTPVAAVETREPAREAAGQEAAGRLPDKEMERFIPSEKVPFDSPLSFPVDI